MMKGGLLGAAAGLGNIFLHDSSHRNGYDQVGSDSQMGNDDKLSSKLLKLSLYTIGGLIAGRLAQNMNKKETEEMRFWEIKNQGRYPGLTTDMHKKTAEAKNDISI